jgi:hypothetical protein
MVVYFFYTRPVIGMIILPCLPKLKTGFKVRIVMVSQKADKTSLAMLIFLSRTYESGSKLTNVLKTRISL